MTNYQKHNKTTFWMDILIKAIFMIAILAVAILISGCASKQGIICKDNYMYAVSPQKTEIIKENGNFKKCRWS